MSARSCGRRAPERGARAERGAHTSRRPRRSGADEIRRSCWGRTRGAGCAWGANGDGQPAPSSGVCVGVWIGVASSLSPTEACGHPARGLAAPPSNSRGFLFPASYPSPGERE